ncbi:MAG TPA: hypothetical protein VEF89_04660 [Solirubrobacteraceae bacterium]|nr:hypothetical protein [Solirubrobacteraceae bacterium]
MLSINDQFAPAAAFLGSATVDANPAHVTYVVDTARDAPNHSIVGDHAYWVSGLTIRSQSHTATNGDPEGETDVFSHGFGTSDPVASGSAPGTGTLTGGNMGPLACAGLTQTWSPPAPAPASDTLDINATNIATASIDVSRAHVDCNVNLNITTDGPITVTLAGCNRTVQAG